MTDETKDAPKADEAKAKRPYIRRQTGDVAQDVSPEFEPLPQPELVTAISPRNFTVLLRHDAPYHLKTGENRVPRIVAEHPYAIAHGVRILAA